MTTKDYELIAGALRKIVNWKATDFQTGEVVSHHLRFSVRLVDNLAHELKEDNPEFDPEKFIESVWKGI